MNVTTFASRRAFRAWLTKNHRTTTELLVRCYKVQAKAKGLTYREALDEALCFGWIDGVRRSVDDESFSVRFTPRKTKTTWSTINIKRAEELVADDRMHPSGRAAFAARDPENTKRYSFEVRRKELDPASLRKLRANKGAWTFFQAQPPWYQRTSIFWVMEAKREETRARRLASLIESSEHGLPIKLLDRGQGKRPTGSPVGNR